MNLVEVFYTQVIPVGLWLVMLALGLSLTPTDILRVFARPKAALAGLIAQMLLLPLIALLITVVLDLSPAVSAGLIILSACPGGASAGAYVFASRGDVALSISITAVNSMLTVLTLPFISLFAVWLYLDSMTLTSIPAQEMIWELAKLTIVPVAAGMLARRFWAEKVRKIVEVLRNVTLVFLIAMIVTGTLVSWEVLVENFWTAALAAAALNVLAMLGGYLLSRALKLDLAQTITIVFEVGIQNVTLALLVTMTLYKQPALAIAALVYAVLQKLTALGFLSVARYWNKKAARAELQARTPAIETSLSP